MSTPVPSVPPILVGAAGCLPANFFLRVLALLLDVFLATLVAVLLLTRFILPDKAPNAGEIFRNQMDSMWAESQQAAQANRFPILTLHDDYLQLSETVVLSLFFVLLTYFTLSEWFWRGTTLGKHVFRLRAARWGDAQPPRPFESLARCLFKAASLLWWPLLVINALVLVLHSDRRAGHDYLARTLVTGDRLPPPPDPSLDSEL